MFKTGYLLNTKEKFDAAVFNKAEVAIWQAVRSIITAGKLKDMTK
jgi:hypothetical protein